jgi:hypothetical protein
MQRILSCYMITTHGPTSRRKTVTPLRRRSGFATFILAALAVPTTIIAQPVKVTIDLSSASITSNVPFDEPFTLTGSAGTQVQRLTVTYREAPELCSPVRAAKKYCAKPANPAPASVPQTWERRTSDGNTFAFTVGPLQPNTCYTLAFRQFLQPAGEAERKLLRDELSEKFRTAITQAGEQGFLKSEDKTALRDELQRTADEFVRDKFRAAAPTINLNAVEKELGVVFGHADKITADEEGIETFKTSSAEELCLDPLKCKPDPAAWDVVRTRLAALVADPAALVPGAKSMWTLALNPSREGLKTVTVSQVAAILSGSTAAAIQSVLEGRGKISGSLIVPASAPDPDSIGLIADFLQVTSSTAFATNAGPLMNAGFQKEMSTAIDQVRELARLYADIPAHQAAITATQFADVLAGFLLQQEFSITTEPTIITADANPYISADTGFGYVARLDKGYPYYGVNFYRVPVNKRAPLGRFSGAERFWRSASILLGLTTAAFEDSRTKNFLSAGSPMLGVGYRVNQFLKINGGGIAFKQVSSNPVSATMKNKYLPFASISIDLDVKAMLKGAGGFLPQ